MTGTTPYSPSICAPHRPSRLESYKAIWIDPEAFSSNYERELAFSQEIWRERLDSAFKGTFVSSVLALNGGGGEGDGSNLDSGVPHEREHGDKVDAGTNGARERIGTATIIGPSGTDSFLDQFGEAGLCTAWLRCGYTLPTGEEALELGWLGHAWHGRE